MSRRLLAGLAALVVGSVNVLALGGGPAQARTTAPVAYVRAAHLSPDTPKVDVYLTAFRGGSTRLWLSGVGYGDVSRYKRFSAGQYAVSMRPAGAPKSSKAALSWTLTLGAGRSYTAAAIGKQALLRGIVVPDSTSTPRSGVGFVRVVQASSSAATVRVLAGDTAVSSAATFGTVSKYVAVPAGRVTLRATSTTDRTLTSTVRLTVASRSVNSVVVLDRQGGGIQARPLVDAAAAGRAPVGGVETGGGGTAADRAMAPDDDVVGFAVRAVGALVATIGLVLLAGRRRGRV